MPVPVETQLMQRHKLRYSEARQLVVGARKQLGMPTTGPWNEELQSLCLQLAGGESAVNSSKPEETATAVQSQSPSPDATVAPTVTTRRGREAAPPSEEAPPADDTTTKKKKKKKILKKVKKDKRAKSVGPPPRRRVKEITAAFDQAAAEGTKSSTTPKTKTTIVIQKKKPTTRPGLQKSASAGARLRTAPKPLSRREATPLIPGSRKSQRVRGFLKSLDQRGSDHGSVTDEDMTQSSHHDDYDEEEEDPVDFGLFKRGNSWRFANRA